MGHSLAPDVDEAHQEGLCEKVDVEDAASDHTPQKQQNSQPQEVSVSLSGEHLGLYFADGHIREVDVENEAEVELSHEEECGQGSPELQMEEGRTKSVDEGQGSHYSQCYQQGDCCADGQVCTGEHGLCEVPCFEIIQCVLHRLIIPTYYNSLKIILNLPFNPDHMEQLQSLKQTLSLPTFPVYPLTSFLSIGSYEIIMLSTILSLMLTLWSGNTFSIYFLNGFMLPVMFIRYGNNLGNYWQWLSILLLGRQIIHNLVVADVCTNLHR